jgi:hypothetical protein
MVMMMDWLNVTWPMMAAASLTTLGLIHAFVWIRQGSPAHLAFSVTALSVAIMALLDLRILHAETLGPPASRTPGRWWPSSATCCLSPSC